MSFCIGRRTAFHSSRRDIHDERLRDRKESLVLPFGVHLPHDLENRTIFELRDYNSQGDFSNEGITAVDDIDIVDGI